MKLLFATDGSTHSKLALEEIANSPYPPKSSMHIISIIDNIASSPGNAPMGAMNEYIVEVGRMAMSKAKENIENAKEVLKMKHPALAITTAIINGSPKIVILEEAEKLNADLIIVGSHGYGAVKYFLLGSVSQAVALHAKCSVEIVRNGKHKQMKILLATDGSKHSKAMVKQFSGRTFAPNTKVRIIFAYERSYMLNASPMGEMNEYNAEEDKLLQKSAAEVTENAANILRAKNPKLSVTTAVIEGSPKVVILEVAEKYGANLIVVGSHGHGAVARFLLGSVSQAVALHAKCSVEIVRNKKQNK